MSTTGEALEAAAGESWRFVGAELWHQHMEQIPLGILLYSNSQKDAENCDTMML